MLYTFLARIDLIVCDILRESRFGLTNGRSPLLIRKSVSVMRALLTLMKLNVKHSPPTLRMRDS